MKKETKTIAEYKAPKCKVVELQISSSLMQINPSSLSGTWGSSINGDTDWNEDGEDYGME